MEDNFNKIKQKLINAFKRILVKILVPILIVVSLLGASIYFFTLDDAVARTNDMSNVPYAVSQYTNGVSVGNDGQLVSSMTAQELWDEMNKNGSRVSLYLDSPEELLKLMNAELVTQYLDTRKNPDKEIDWDSESLNDVDSNNIQGIVKLKREDVDGNNYTMTYVDSETFQRYIDNYNSSGSEADKKIALSHFTLESVTSSSSSGQNDADDTVDVMKWPTDGTTITSEFGLRDAPTSGASTNHRGIDIGISEGTNVYACEAGKVTTASYSESAGNWVVIDHGNGYVSKYMHNSELKVSVGDKVEKGQVIALSGNTGTSTGAHLHFQIEYEGSAVDPLSFKYDNGMGDGTEGVGNDTNNLSETTTKYYAKVATWTEKTTTVESNDPDVSESNQTYYNMTTTNVNYRDMVKGYTMPFDYLWALLVVTEDKDFVLQLADLVYGSEIEITVYDNLEVDTDVVVNTYTKKTKTVTDAKVTVNYGMESTSENSISVSDNWEDEESEDYKVTETEITKTNTLDAAVTKADVWLLTYTQEYTHQKPVTSTSNNTATLDNKEYPNSPNSTSSEDTYGHAENLLSTQKTKYEDLGYEYVDGKTDFVQSKIYNATVNRNKATTNTVETTNYIESTGKTVEKTDIDAEEDNFVTILAKPECKTARTNIQDISSWLFEILEENESDMVDLTKYLLYKSTDKDYGVKEHDFSEYVYTDFSDYASITGDYVVKTDDQNSATVVTDKNKLEEGLKKWLKNANNQKENALSVVDKVLKCQEQYHVNAVFVYAFLRNETGIGTANTDYVNNDNNWGSWDLGHKFSSPEDNIETITRNMENGSIYFKQGRISVTSIGEEYCPNEPAHPTQGDEWIARVQEYMTELYSCMGITESVNGSGAVAEGGAGTIGVYTSTTGRKYNLYLQGSGAPWSDEDYGDSHSMALAGCGPTAEAIIASSYDAKITPETARKDIISKFGGGNHSSATCIGKSLNTLLPGVKTSVGKFDENKIKNCLKKSGQVWLVVQNCKYTSNAHCIALIDYKDSGKVYVAHGTAKNRPYGWDNLSYIKSYIKYADVLYVGGQ